MLLAMALLAGGCSTSHRAHKRKYHDSYTSRTVNTKDLKPADLSAHEDRIVSEALTWLGTPYRYASSDKKKGTDCSGMVLRVFEDAVGRPLPRNSALQAEACRRLKEKDVRPGDLVFFATGSDPRKISHVGIMVNATDFIHASTSKGVVISDINAPYYIRTFIMYGRPE